ncbi:MAG: sugar ABC transporter ATP-binding protein [Elstera sp.]
MIELQGIVKSFPGVKSLDQVNFSARAGEIHALLGENGAGKSTLIKVLAGAYTPDSGTITFGGTPRVWASPRQAQAAGIHVIYQELVLFPDLSVAENIFIGHAPRTRWGLIDRKAMIRKTESALSQLGHRLDPRARVGDLSVADQQMVEIAKALSHDVKLLVLDEPTAVISGKEVVALFERLRRLRDRGVCIIYISHRLEEIFALADRITILKDGKNVRAGAVSEFDRASLVTAMVGRPLADLYPPRPPQSNAAPVVLTAHDIHLPPRVHGVDVSVRAGEIVGLAGMVGSGRSEFAHAIFGSLARTQGRVTLDGDEVPPGNPRLSIQRGIGFLTEDRKAEGLLAQLPVYANMTAPDLAAYTRLGFLRRPQEVALATRDIQRFRIAVPGPTSGVWHLSGGNQQKILLSRWMAIRPKLLILDEPTRGVDVGAKAEIYRLIRALAAEGVAILMISSELPEIIGLCDRVLVMKEGRVMGELAAEALSEEAIMTLATADARAQGEAA